MACPVPGSFIKVSLDESLFWEYIPNCTAIQLATIHPGSDLTITTNDGIHVKEQYEVSHAK